jgi:hypothetical protein
VETLAWCGSILLAGCGLPELLRTLKTRQCSLTWGFLGMWGIGEVCTIVPVLSRNLGAFLVFNYSLNIVIIAVLCYYKYKSGVSAATNSITEGKDVQSWR